MKCNTCREVMCCDGSELQTEERTMIQLSLEQGCTLGAIAPSVQRAPSSITRELKRNGWNDPAAEPKKRGRPRVAGGYLRSQCIQATGSKTRLLSGCRFRLFAPKSPDRLSADFGASVLLCSQGARLVRWRRALEMLEADPIFRAAEVASLADEGLDDDDLKIMAKKLFGGLSSGHKIVLLTITKLVENVEERTLVLLDEPEAHLHPPLLSAFVRALSDLLSNRNGVAIIATHSPVVLQEVPSTCAWKVRRSGKSVEAERPDIETFGENVGVLTREVFGLEVTDSGFHQLLREAARDEQNFQAVLEKFNSELGGEARALVRALIANRGNRGADA